MNRTVPRSNRDTSASGNGKHKQLSGGLDDRQIFESVLETEIPIDSNPEVPLKRIIQEVRLPPSNATYSS
jgi:hypothetical protein